MRKALRLARREYIASTRTKGFLIGLLIAPIVMSGGLIAMKLTEGQVDTRDRRVAVIDRSGRLMPSILADAESRNGRYVLDSESGEKVKPAYLFEEVPAAPDRPSQHLALSERVRRGELAAFLDIGEDVMAPDLEAGGGRITYHGKGTALDELRRWIENVVNPHLRRLRLVEAGVDPASVDALLHWLPVQAMGLVDVDGDSGQISVARRDHPAEAVAVPIAASFMMILMMLMGAIPLLNSVMEEKTQRIAEVLLGAITPFEFMMGKVLGGLAVSLTATAFYALIGVVAVVYMGWADHVPYGILPWFVPYMVLAILMLGSGLAALGAACSDAKDAQNLGLPAVLPIIVPMFLLGPVLKEPNSALATWVSLVPPLSPMMMMMRLGHPEGIPLWQPSVALVGVALFTVFTIFAGGRIFRIAILTQGQSPRMGELVRWALRG
ncbi:ABC transporter permease [Candidatus Latescibacterota bacterium]